MAMYQLKKNHQAGSYLNRALAVNKNFSEKKLAQEMLEKIKAFIPGDKTPGADALEAETVFQEDSELEDITDEKGKMDEAFAEDFMKDILDKKGDF